MTTEELQTSTRVYSEICKTEDQLRLARIAMKNVSAEPFDEHSTALKVYLELEWEYADLSLVKTFMESYIRRIEDKLTGLRKQFEEL